MDSNFLKNYHRRSLQPRQDGGGSRDNYSAPGQGLGGLASYRSAPTSYYADFVGRDSTDVDFLCRPSSPETERILERFISGTAEGVVQSGNRGGGDGEFPMTMKREETGEGLAEQGSYSSPVSRNMGMEYRVAGGDGTDATRVVPAKVGYVPSNLVRHSSSPAGLFDDINDDEGGFSSVQFSPIGKINNFRTTFAGRNVTKFSGTMSPIHRIGKKNTVEVSPSTSSGDHYEVVNFGRHSGRGYLTGFPIGSFNDSIMSPGNLFADRQMGGNDDEDVFSGQIAEEGEEEKRIVRPLAHHLSLPSKSSEIESFLQMQDSVPCKVRAKRGCATHPRSIAERVRRTKISERIRKLQDLVPNMDKQTNTADMLDLAVDYIKDLQGQVKTLSDSHARCTCSNIKSL